MELHLAVVTSPHPSIHPSIIKNASAMNPDIMNRNHGCGRMAMVTWALETNRFGANASGDIRKKLHRMNPDTSVVQNGPSLTNSTTGRMTLYQ